MLVWAKSLKLSLRRASSSPCPRPNIVGTAAKGCCRDIGQRASPELLLTFDSLQHVSSRTWLLGFE